MESIIDQPLCHILRIYSDLFEGTQIQSQSMSYFSIESGVKNRIVVGQNGTKIICIQYSILSHFFQSIRTEQSDIRIRHQKNTGSTIWCGSNCTTPFFMT